MKGSLLVSFEGVSAGRKSMLSSSLVDTLQSLKEIEATALQERPDTQDPGTIVSIILGAPAVVIAVKAIAAWMIRNNQSDVTIQTKDGNVVLKNLKSDDVAKAIKALEAVIK